MSDDKFKEILNEIRDLKFEFIEFKTKMETELIAKEKQCDYHKDKLMTIDKIIHGNGQKGLKQQMAELEAKIAIIVLLGTSLVNLLWKYWIK